MNKSVHISLVKDDNSLYHADMLIDDTNVKQADLTQKK